MIPKTHPTLRALQVEAISLCRNAGLSIANLSLASDVQDVRREAGSLLHGISAARTIAMKAGVFSQVFEITNPAQWALDQLWMATTAEIHAGLEVEAAHG